MTAAVATTPTANAPRSGVQVHWVKMIGHGYGSAGLVARVGDGTRTVGMTCALDRVATVTVAGRVWEPPTGGEVTFKGTGVSAAVTGARAAAAAVGLCADVTVSLRVRLPQGSGAEDGPTARAAAHALFRAVEQARLLDGDPQDALLTVMDAATSAVGESVLHARGTALVDLDSHAVLARLPRLSLLTGGPRERVAASAADGPVPVQVPSRVLADLLAGRESAAPALLTALAASTAALSLEECGGDPAVHALAARARDLVTPGGGALLHVDAGLLVAAVGTIDAREAAATVAHLLSSAEPDGWVTGCCLSSVI